MSFVVDCRVCGTVVAECDTEDEARVVHGRHEGLQGHDADITEAVDDLRRPRCLCGLKKRPGSCGWCEE